jgi:hypothetical protein
MFELFSLLKTVEFFSENDNMNNTIIPDPIPISWIIIVFIIAFGTAYIAYSCNEAETPATRAVVTLFAFFFSGIYLIYYFIIYVLFNKNCSGRRINNVVTNIVKKKV